MSYLIRLNTWIIVIFYKRIKVFFLKESKIAGRIKSNPSPAIKMKLSAVALKAGQAIQAKAKKNHSDCRLMILT
jgi:hypothetical protein